jgi:hypothetical protein
MTHIPFLSAQHSDPTSPIIPIAYYPSHILFFAKKKVQKLYGIRIRTALAFVSFEEVLGK